MKKRIWIEKGQVAEYRLESEQSDYAWSGCYITPRIADGKCVFRVMQCYKGSHDTSVMIDCESYELARDFIENLYKDPETIKIKKRITFDLHFEIPYTEHVPCFHKEDNTPLVADYKMAHQLRSAALETVDELVTHSSRIQIEMIDLGTGKVIAKDTLKDRTTSE